MLLGWIAGLVVFLIACAAAWNWFEHLPKPITVANLERSLRRGKRGPNAEETRKALASDPEFRKQLLESLREEASTGDDGRPRNLTRLPASLNRASGGNHLRSDSADRDDSNAAIFDSVFKSA